MLEIKLISLVLLAIVCGPVFGLDNVQDVEKDIYQEAYQFVDECGSKDVTSCFKERALHYLERLPNQVELGAGVRIKPTTDRQSRQFAPVVLPSEPNAREEALTRALIERASDYLSSHTFELRLPTETVQEMQRSFNGEVEEARKKKKKGGGGGLMALVMMKVALLGAIALKVLGLVAFKALLISKIALTLSAVIALKKLLEQKHHTSTYEVVAHPHHDEHHYDRSFSQELAYRGQEQAGVVKSD